MSDAGFQRGRHSQGTPGHVQERPQCDTENPGLTFLGARLWHEFECWEGLVFAGAGISRPAAALHAPLPRALSPTWNCCPGLRPCGVLRPPLIWGWEVGSPGLNLQGRGCFSFPAAAFLEPYRKIQPVQSRNKVKYNSISPSLIKLEILASKGNS